MDTLLNTIPNPIFFKDQYGIYRGCNRAFSKRILGISRAEIIGLRSQDLKDQISSELAACYQHHEEKMRLKGGTHSFETEVPCADGIRREFLFSIASVSNDDGQEIGIIGVMLDLTEKNRGVLETTDTVRKEINQPLQTILEYSKLLLAAPPSHVFISYVRENQDQVDRLCQDLESHGVKVWLDRNDITPGIFWKDAIRKAIQNGAFFIACFSKEYSEKTSTHMNEELNLAIEVLRKRPREQAWFIPVVLSGDVPDWEIFPGKTLQDIQWVPLYEDWKAGIQKILSVIKPIPPEIQNLISALCSKDSNVRRQAAEALGNIGPEAKAAVPALIESLKDGEEGVREAAAKSLGKIGPEAKAAVQALIEMLKDEDKYVLGAATEALGYIGIEAKAAVPTLIGALKDPDIDFRRLAARTLGKIGPEAKAAVPALVEALKDNDGNVRWFTAEALKKINTPEAKKALEKYKKKSD
jgi:PAS domain S-box-containing protein